MAVVRGPWPARKTGKFKRAERMEFVSDELTTVMVSLDHLVRDYAAETRPAHTELRLAIECVHDALHKLTRK
jgi:hypothetical protein